MKVLLSCLYIISLYIIFLFQVVGDRCTSSLGSSPHNKDVFIIFTPLVFLTLSQSRGYSSDASIFYSRFSSKIRSFMLQRYILPVKNKLFSSVSINHLITKRNIMSHSSATTFVGSTYGMKRNLQTNKLIWPLLSSIIFFSITNHK